MEWNDGLMPVAVRQFVQQTTEDHKWIVCDGPVDALWIENMNTVCVVVKLSLDMKRHPVGYIWALIPYR